MIPGQTITFAALAASRKVCASCVSESTSLAHTRPFLVQSSPVPGQNVSLLFTPANATNASSSGNSSLFAAFLQGITPTFVPLNGIVDGSTPINITVPLMLQGFAFVAITNSSSEHGDNFTVAGPAFLNFPFSNNGSLTTTSISGVE